jgi:hypothetical protein
LGVQGYTITNAGQAIDVVAEAMSAKGDRSSMRCTPNNRSISRCGVWLMAQGGAPSLAALVRSVAEIHPEFGLCTSNGIKGWLAL